MMGLIKSALGRNDNNRRQAEAIANRFVDLYRQGRIRGTPCFNHFLFQELCRELPPELAQEVMTRFQRRLARGYPNAEDFLRWDIVMAVYERDCNAQLGNSKRREIRVDEARVQQLCHGLPQQLAAEVMARFLRRLAHGYPKTVALQQILALPWPGTKDYARTFKPIVTVAGC